MPKIKTWEVAPIDTSINDKQFLDSYGVEVKHGSMIMIESNYNYQHFNNRPAVVEWNSEKGMYTFRFTDGKCIGLNHDFHGIHKFKVTGQI